MDILVEMDMFSELGYCYFYYGKAVCDGGQGQRFTSLASVKIAIYATQLNTNYTRRTKLNSNWISILGLFD